jgi:hypothetical protein
MGMDHVSLTHTILDNSGTPQHADIALPRRPNRLLQQMVIRQQQGSPRALRLHNAAGHAPPIAAVLKALLTALHHCAVASCCALQQSTQVTEVFEEFVVSNLQ